MRIQHTLLAARVGRYSDSRARLPRLRRLIPTGAPYGPGMAGLAGMPPAMMGGGMPGYEAFQKRPRRKRSMAGIQA